MRNRVEFIAPFFKWINGLPSLDLFKDVDPLVENENLMNMITFDKSSLDERKCYLEKCKADREPECEDDIGNIFERLND